MAKHRHEHLDKLTGMVVKTFLQVSVLRNVDRYKDCDIDRLSGRI